MKIWVHLYVHTYMCTLISVVKCTSTSTWLHAAVNHDFCSAGGCVLKRIKRNDRKVRSEKKKEDLIGKVEEK